MDREEGFMGCPGCGAVWQGTWESTDDVTCPECGTALEPIDKDELPTE